jgi:adenylyltransferase/sulfurtransferase
MNRYQRQIALPEIGMAGQQKLTDAKVLVVGAGGLGCPVLQNLAAAGVGTIGIVDGDLVVVYILKRQFLYNNSDCGKSKASSASDALGKLNPNIKVFAPRR